MFDTTSFLLQCLIWGVFAICGALLAKNKNRSQTLWAVNCFLSGLIGLIVLACCNTLEYDEDYEDYPSDTIGKYALVLAILLGIYNVWTAYQIRQAQHEAMVWNYMLNFI